MSSGRRRLVIRDPPQLALNLIALTGGSDPSGVAGDADGVDPVAAADLRDGMGQVGTEPLAQPALQRSRLTRTRRPAGGGRSPVGWALACVGAKLNASRNYFSCKTDKTFPDGSLNQAM
jgi:hypothetical protein